jgi:DNA-binding HxlR family transcriptional regulator
MQRTSFSGWPCSIARTLDLLGDGWSPLVLREIFYGASRFEDVQQGLSISRNTLTGRLRRLVEDGLLDRHAYQTRPVRYDYALTDKGRDLFGVLAAMSRWGDKWLTDAAGVPLVLHDNRCGHDTYADVVCHECREPLVADVVTVRPGPGYPQRLLDDPDIRRRFQAATPPQG